MHGTLGVHMTVNDFAQQTGFGVFKKQTRGKEWIKIGRLSLFNGSLFPGGDSIRIRGSVLVQSSLGCMHTTSCSDARGDGIKMD